VQKDKDSQENKRNVLQKDVREAKDSPRREMLVL